MSFNSACRVQRRQPVSRDGMSLMIGCRRPQPPTATDNRPMTLKAIEICQQFERPSAWWPLLASGEPAPDCLALLEGNGRYAITFLHDR